MSTSAIMSSSTTDNNNSNLPDNKWCRNAFDQAVEKSAKRGKWTVDETVLLEQSIEQYCTRRGIPKSKLCSETDHRSEIKGAWLEIASVLPHRNVQSIYRKGVRQLHPFKRGDWIREEEQILFEMVQRHGKKWTLIQNNLKRSSDSCRDKYREMSKEYIKGRWLPDEVERLLINVRETLKIPSSMFPSPPPANTQDLLCEEQDSSTIVAGSNNTNNIYNAEQQGTDQQLLMDNYIPSEYKPTPAQARYFSSSVIAINQYCEQKPTKIPWSVLSKRMANRSRLSCLKKWQKMTAGKMIDTLYEDEENDNGLNNIILGSEETTTAANNVNVKISSPSTESSATADTDSRSSKRKASKSVSSKNKSRKEERSTRINVEQSPLARTPLAAAAEPIIIHHQQQLKKADVVNNDSCVFKLDSEADVELLQQLSATKARRPTDIAWATGLSHPKAFARYQEILDAVEREDDSDKVLNMPLFAQAKLLLERAGYANL